MQREGGCTVVRQGHLIAVVGIFLIGCAVLLLVVGCAVTRSEAPKEGQGHTEATMKEQGRSPQATASEEARCEGRQPFERPYEPNEEGWLTNDVPGCLRGGLLSGTDSNDMLDGLAGDDVIHGGPGDDSEVYGDGGEDVIYGGAGDDELEGGWGKDVIYGGDGNDLLDGASNDDGERDELYCGNGKDYYAADKHDYVDSSCEVKRPPLPTA